MQRYQHAGNKQVSKDYASEKYWDEQRKTQVQVCGNTRRRVSRPRGCIFGGNSSSVYEEWKRESKYLRDRTCLRLRAKAFCKQKEAPASDLERSSCIRVVSKKEQCTTKLFFLTTNKQSTACFIVLATANGPTGVTFVQYACHAWGRPHLKVNGTEEIHMIAHRRGHIECTLVWFCHATRSSIQNFRK